jgi:hypothetical protein
MCKKQSVFVCLPTARRNFKKKKEGACKPLASDFLFLPTRAGGCCGCGSDSQKLFHLSSQKLSLLP